MKKTTFFLILLFSFSISAFQCRKNNNSRTSSCIKGQLIDAICGNTIVKVIEGEYDPSRVVNSWQDPQTGNTYTNVFAISNYCDMQDKLTIGQDFFFYFEDGGSVNNCVICMAVRATPQKAHKIKLTTSCND